MVEALTALDTDPVAVAATQAARVTVDSDLGRMTSDGPCASPAHTSSTHGELDLPTVSAGAAVASTAAAAAAAVSDTALEAALSSAPLVPGAKDQSRSRKESRFKVVKVVDGRASADAGVATPAARVSVESAPAQVAGTPTSQQGVAGVNGSQQDALCIVNKKLQASPPAPLPPPSPLHKSSVPPACGCGCGPVAFLVNNVACAALCGCCCGQQPGVCAAWFHADVVSVRHSVPVLCRS